MSSLEDPSGQANNVFLWEGTFNRWLIWIKRVKDKRVFRGFPVSLKASNSPTQWNSYCCFDLKEQQSNDPFKG